jgi:hypothetical protein
MYYYDPGITNGPQRNADYGANETRLAYLVYLTCNNYVPGVPPIPSIPSFGSYACMRKPRLVRPVVRVAGG